MVSMQVKAVGKLDCLFFVLLLPVILLLNYSPSLGFNVAINILLLLEV